jgi:transposase
MMRGGCAKVRQALSTSALAAIRSNPAIQAFYARLTAKNKPGKVIVVAYLRKLLTILNAMIKTGQHWRP